MMAVPIEGEAETVNLGVEGPTPSTPSRTSVTCGFVQKCALTCAFGLPGLTAPNPIWPSNRLRIATVRERDVGLEDPFGNHYPQPGSNSAATQDMRVALPAPGSSATRMDSSLLTPAVRRPPEGMPGLPPDRAFVLPAWRPAAARKGRLAP